jgi:GH24 family phage-related lysozyme (muramidase)
VTNTAPITLEQLFRFYKALPHQAAALQLLEQDLAVNGYAVAMRRDRAWFATWSQDGKQQDLGAALKLIQSFEGCHLDAYLCPAGVWTIGWGNTRYQDGRPVKENDKINRIEADMLLRQEVDRIAAKLAKDVPGWREMTDHQRSALVSFAYNLGAGFYGAVDFETISKRLKEKDWQRVPEAMMLYRNPGSNFEAGLKRRREAEGKLWSQGLPQQPQASPYKAKPSDPFSTKLSPHFTLGEFALGQPARRFTAQHQVDTAIELAAFLERVRVAFVASASPSQADTDLLQSIDQSAAPVDRSTSTTRQAWELWISTLTVQTSTRCKLVRQELAVQHRLWRTQGVCALWDSSGTT